MIAYYISAHGYGHGVRATSVIRALNEAYPGIPIEVTSALPVAFLQNRLGADAPVTYRAAQFDLGMVQLDSIRVDVAATLRAVSQLYDQRDTWVGQEVAYLRQKGVRILVSDIPAMPLEAAHGVGIPGVAIGNFAWNWIYAPFAERDPKWHPIIKALEEGYSRSSLLLKLPFSEPMDIFTTKEDIPLVASSGVAQREALANLVGADPGKRWILLSFTTLDWGEEALARLQSLDEYAFFTVKPLQWAGRNLHAVDREKVSFSDVLATVDAVISKPGFGILSECIVNEKPLIYAEREDFIEYPILERAIHRYLQHVHIPAERLYQGDVGESLAAIWQASKPTDTLPCGGAEVAARRIHELMA